MKITHAEAIALNIPFYADHVTRAMQRASTHDERVWVVRLETDNGLVGWGRQSRPAIGRWPRRAKPGQPDKPRRHWLWPASRLPRPSGPRQRRARTRTARRQAPRPLPHLLVGYRYAAPRLGCRGRGIAKARVHHL